MPPLKLSAEDSSFYKEMMKNYDLKKKQNELVKLLQGTSLNGNMDGIGGELSFGNNDMGIKLNGSVPFKGKPSLSGVSAFFPAFGGRMDIGHKKGFFGNQPNDKTTANMTWKF